MAITDARVSLDPGKPTRAASPDTFVLTSITLVAVASAVALHAQAGLTLISAVGGALLLQGGLILFHFLVRRSELAADLRRENAQLASTLERLGSPADVGAGQTNGLAAEGAPAESSGRALPIGEQLASLKQRPTSATVSKGSPPGPLGKPPAATSSSATPPRTAPSKWSLAGIPEAPRRPDLPGNARRTPPLPSPGLDQGSSMPIAPDVTPAAIDPEQRIWEYRPGDKPFSASEANMPAPKADRLAPPPLMSHPPVPKAPATPQRRPSDAGIEQIHDLIKKLAEDINSGRSRVSAEASFGISTSSSASPELALERSVEALKATSHVMRGAATPSDDAGRVVSGIAQGLDAGIASQPRSPSAPKPKMSMTDLLGQAQIDLFLEPILGFPDHRARHYEVSMRLRGGSGDFADPRHDSGMRASGMLPLLDAFKVSCAARIAQRLEERGSASSLFSALSGDTLASNRLVADIESAAGDLKAIYSRLVITFPQSDVRAFTPGHWAVLKDLAALGFAFGMDAVTDLDMNFETLRAADFIYVKLDAPVFLEGLAAAGGHIPASDICRYLAKLGLTVIVGRIEDEMQLARVLGFGVLFGQGTLFGAPRPVKADLVREQRGAAA